MDGKNKLGTMLREARQQRGLSLRELGERLKKADGTNLSPQYLNDIEHGRRNPPDEPMLRQLAKVLHVEASVLLALAGQQPKEVAQYLSEMPEESETVGRLFRAAREHGFRDWAALEREIEKSGRRKSQ
jgi:transcriptional regulator with XRE-family HTH domain